MRGITEKRDAAIRNVLRLALPRHMPKFLVDGVHIDEAVLLQPQPRLGLQNPAHGSVESLARDAPGFHGILQALERGVGHRRH